MPNYINRVRDASTFADYFTALRAIYPVSIANPDRVLKLAQTIAADYPTVDLWEHLYPVLEHSMRNCAELRKFPTLFAHNLRERLRREAARLEARERREHRTGIAHRHLLRAHSRVTKADHAYSRWSALLLDQVLDKLDPLTRDYLLARADGTSVKQVALDLGVGVRTLRNRYGSDEKLSRWVLKEVRRMVLAMPPGDRKLLARHLKAAGLRPDHVRRLCGTTLVADSSVPVLNEATLLAALGWKISGKFSRRFGEFRLVGSKAITCRREMQCA